MPCITGDPFGCVAPYMPFACANPNGTDGLPSRCVFASPSVGDPCVDDLDCFGGSYQPLNAFLRCDAGGVCLPKPGQNACAQSGDCAAGTYCNATASSQVSIAACTL